MKERIDANNYELHDCTNQLSPHSPHPSPHSSSDDQTAILKWRQKSINSKHREAKAEGENRKSLFEKKENGQHDTTERSSSNK